MGKFTLCSLQNACKSEILVKKSRFISQGFEIQNSESASALISDVKKVYHDAKHNTFGYILANGYAKSSDDGEPHGTAGVQILNAMKSENLENTLIVVTRYFGGTLLGVGGLSRAYFDSAQNLILRYKIVKIMHDIVDISFSYEFYGKILNLINFFKIKILDTTFSEIVNVRIAIASDIFEKFFNRVGEVTGNKFFLEEIKQEYL